MEEDIAHVIAKIDAKIRDLTRAKRVLLEEFGGKHEETTRTTPPTQDEETGEKRRKNRDVIVDLIRHYGPMTRGEILNRTGLPLGSVTWSLNDKELFIPKEGRWYLVEHKGDV